MTEQQRQTPTHVGMVSLLFIILISAVSDACLLSWTGGQKCSTLVLLQETAAHVEITSMCCSRLLCSFSMHDSNHRTETWLAAV